MKFLATYNGDKGLVELWDAAALYQRNFYFACMRCASNDLVLERPFSSRIDAEEFCKNTARILTNAHVLGAKHEFSTERELLEYLDQMKPGPGAEWAGELEETDDAYVRWVRNTETGETRLEELEPRVKEIKPLATWTAYGGDI